MPQNPDTNPQVPELSSKFTDEAEQLVGELTQKTGKKALVLIVDDTPIKLDQAAVLFKRAAEGGNVGYIVSAQTNGEDTINLYEAFRQADSQEDPHTVVLFLDGNLYRTVKPTQYKFGADVARKIAEISQTRGWKMPYIVGNSIDTNMNNKLAKDFPDSYLTGYDLDPTPVFEAIEAHL